MKKEVGKKQIGGTLMQNLYEELVEYSNSDVYPFHMPGHKRQIKLIEDPYQIDITEIDGFDNLHHAQGVLKKLQEKAAGLYGAEETCVLVNGSTSGILSAVSTCVKRNGLLLMARSCHKSVYHAAALGNLKVQYLYPHTERKYGINCGQNPEFIRKMLINFPEIQAVVITSPTYDGVTSDVRSIADVVHSFKIPLIVDEAHGAHFGFDSYFPKSAVSLGADIVIQSLHKTLPALTQTALLHVNGRLVDRDRLKHFLSIYQTSSPSYVLMSSVDQCLGLLKTQSGELFTLFKKRLEKFYQDMKSLQKIHLVTAQDIDKDDNHKFDPSKLILSVKYCNITGHELADRLRSSYQLEVEMEAIDYILALTSVMDTDEGFTRLANALREIDKELIYVDGGFTKKIPECEAVKTIEEAGEMEHVVIPLMESAREISAEFLYLYPPGIPLIVPGERISRDLLDCIRDLKEQGLNLQGLSDYNNEWIKICNTTI